MAAAQVTRLEFSEKMSDDEFLDYLKKEGLKERDCSEGSATKEISYTLLRNQQKSIEKSAEINHEITRNHPMKSRRLRVRPLLFVT